MEQSKAGKKLDLVVSGYLIFNRKLLLIHHRKLGLWLAPGGHIEANEDPEQAIKREFSEEIGLDIQVPQIVRLPPSTPHVRDLPLPFYSNVHNVGDHDHACLYFLCTTDSIEKISANLDETHGYRWITQKELEKANDLKADVKEIAKIAFQEAKKLEKRL